MKGNVKSAIFVNKYLIINVNDGKNTFLMQVRIVINVNALTLTVLENVIFSIKAGKQRGRQMNRL